MKSKEEMDFRENLHTGDTNENILEIRKGKLKTII